MIKPPSPPARPPSARRPARTWLSTSSESRSVQIGVVVTILLHVLLLIFAPKLERYFGDRALDSTATNQPAPSYEIELMPSEPTPPEVKPPQFVEANPAAPDNAPDETNLVAAQNQQVAQEKPTPDGKSDAPASKGDPDTASTAIVSGRQADPQPSAPPPEPPSDQPEKKPEEVSRREETPLPGSEKFEGENPDGFGANVGKPAPNATPVPERIEGSPDSKNTTGRPSLYYQAVDRTRPQTRPTLAPNVVRARPSPLANRDFGTENIGAVAYNAKWSAYGEYMQKFIETVDVQWQRIVMQSNVYPPSGTKVVVKFRMDKTGQIAEIINVSGTGGRAAEDGCVSAIVARAPYGVWPEDMVGVLGESQEITFTFFYQ